MKKRLISFVQLAIGAGLIAFIVFKLRANGDLGKIRDAAIIAAHNWHLLALGFGVFLVCIALCAIRWNILLKSQGLRIPFRRVLVLYFIGHFFNSFLLGATGGDLIKAIYAAKETAHKKTEIISTIFIDRIIGLLALLGLMILVAAIRFRFFLRHEETRMALIFGAAMLLVSVGGLILVFRQNLFERWEFFKRLERKTAVGEIIRKVYDAFHLCFSHRGVLAKTITISFINHVAFVVCLAMLGWALGIALPFRDYLTVVPTIGAISALPVTPGGLGMREGASIYLFRIFDVPAASAFTLSLLAYSAILFWGIVGGVVYIFYTYKMGATPAKDMEQQN